MEGRDLSHPTTRNISILAIILAVVAVISSIVAIQSSNNATAKLNGQDKKIIELNKEVKLLDRPASNGVGSGPNANTQPATTSPPNGSGQ